MNQINEGLRVLALREFMNRPEGWGRDQGREVYQRMLRFVEASPGTMIFKVSMKGVQRIDISFASETVVGKWWYYQKELVYYTYDSLAWSWNQTVLSSVPTAVMSDFPSAAIAMPSCEVGPEVICSGSPPGKRCRQR